MNRSRLNQLLEFLDQSPDDPFTRYSVAYEYLLQGNLTAAEGYFRQMLTRHPEYIGTYYHLGKTLESLDKRDEALDVYHAGIKMATKLNDAHNLRELKAALLAFEQAEEEEDEDEW